VISLSSPTPWSAGHLCRVRELSPLVVVYDWPWWGASENQIAIQPRRRPATDVPPPSHGRPARLIPRASLSPASPRETAGACGRPTPLNPPRARPELVVGFHCATAHYPRPTGPAGRLRLRDGRISMMMLSIKQLRASDPICERPCTSPSAPRRSARPLAGRLPHQPGPAQLRHAYPLQLLRRARRSTTSHLIYHQIDTTHRRACPWPHAQIDPSVPVRPPVNPLLNVQILASSCMPASIPAACTVIVEAFYLVFACTCLLPAAVDRWQLFDRQKKER
jgi:hypothetical protein